MKVTSDDSLNRPHPPLIRSLLRFFLTLESVFRTISLTRRLTWVFPRDLIFNTEPGLDVLERGSNVSRERYQSFHRGPQVRVGTLLLNFYNR